MAGYRPRGQPRGTTRPGSRGRQRASVRTPLVAEPTHPGIALFPSVSPGEKMVVVETAESTGAKVAGPVPLPTRIEKFCVIRSPFIDKDSQEQFEIRTHKRLIDVLEPSGNTIRALMRLNLPAGVDIEIKL